uniref:HDC09246 n=1 Tax=Drosophila melanogaster TaxID=7227 RepID=Q6ILJ7_DROME|nr:TPA_inf: HDC09246 [Drosophila melanogaster]
MAGVKLNSKSSFGIQVLRYTAARTYGEGVLRYGVRCAAYGVCTTAESHAHSFAAACLRPTTSAVVWQCHWQKQQAIMPHSSEPEPTCPGYGIRDTGHGTQTPNHTHCHTHTRIRIRRR